MIITVCLNQTSTIPKKEVEGKTTKSTSDLKGFIRKGVRTEIEIGRKSVLGEGLEWSAKRSEEGRHLEPECEGLLLLLLMCYNRASQLHMHAFLLQQPHLTTGSKMIK